MVKLAGLVSCRDRLAQLQTFGILETPVLQAFLWHPHKLQQPVFLNHRDTAPTDFLTTTFRSISQGMLA
jgi:hypothetical protein